MLKITNFSLFIMLLCIQTIHAQTDSPNAAPDRSQLQSIIDHNQRINKGLDRFDRIDGLKTLRPYAEYEPAKTLLISGGFDFDSEQAKTTIIANLPGDVDLLIYTRSEKEIDRLREKFADLIDDDRLHFLVINSSGQGFWARDTIPVPVYLKKGNKTGFGVVDAKYYHSFEPDQQIADYFGGQLITHQNFFEGGNFMNDAEGNCFVVDKKDTALIKDQIFTELYGCATLTRMPFVAGIGHIDERMKILEDGVAVTDSETYKKILEEKGFETTLLPRPEQKYETYANSLLINGTLFLPVYDEQTDSEAIAIYRSFGLKVVPIKTNTLSNKGLGSIHCITMTYPVAIPARHDAKTVIGQLFQSPRLLLTPDRTRVRAFD